MFARWLEGQPVGAPDDVGFEGGLEALDGFEGAGGGLLLGGGVSCAVGIGEGGGGGHTKWTWVEPLESSPGGGRTG